MKPRIFISYSGHDAFEASLLQYALETKLKSKDVTAWTFNRDQGPAEKSVASSLKRKIRNSHATIFLVSPKTLDSGATQWMELAYSDAFDVPTYVLLHHLDYQQLKTAQSGVPPLVLAAHCNPAVDWPKIVKAIEKKLPGRRRRG